MGSTQAVPHPVEQHFKCRVQSASVLHSCSQLVLLGSRVGQVPGLLPKILNIQNQQLLYLK